jgi:hypothetical protein
MAEEEGKYIPSKSWAEVIRKVQAGFIPETLLDGERGECPDPYLDFCFAVIVEGQPAGDLAPAIDRLADDSDRPRQKDGPAEKESRDLAIHRLSLFFILSRTKFPVM